MAESFFRHEKEASKGGDERRRGGGEERSKIEKPKKEGRHWRSRGLSLI